MRTDTVGVCAAERLRPWWGGAAVVAGCGLAALERLVGGSWSLAAALVAGGLAVAVGWMLVARRRLARLTAIAQSPEPVELLVLGDVTSYDARITRRLLLAPPGSPAKLPWSLPDDGVAPYFLSHEPPTVLGLRARSEPSWVAPVATDGRPFRISAAARRELVEACGDGTPEPPEGDATRATGVFKATTPAAGKWRLRLIGASAVCAAFLPLLLLRDELATIFGVVFGTQGLLAVAWCATFGHGAFTTLDVDEKRVTIRWPLGARSLTWSEVEQVVVVGRHVAALDAARRERQVATLGGMAVGVAGGHLHVEHTADVGASWGATHEPDEPDDELAPRFERIGRSRLGTSPYIRITGPGGRTFARLRSTHAWDAAEALAHAAAVRGVELHIG